MMNFRNRERFDNGINAGSMADIAFLLLIFFLVTTTIRVDKGIMVKLPPWSPDVNNVLPNPRNIFSVLLNAENELLVRGERLAIDQLRGRAKDFIMNTTKDPKLAKKPSMAIISLKNDRGTDYESYIMVYNELAAAYHELWDDEAIRLIGEKFSPELPKSIRIQIKRKIPFVLSEAEPSDYTKDE